MASVRKRKEALALVPVAVGKKVEVTEAVLLQRIKELETDNARLREQGEKWRGGCVAGYARELQLENELQRRGLPVPAKRQKTTPCGI